MIDTVVEYMSGPPILGYAVVIAFIVGIVFSPWTGGIFYLILFYLVYELILVILAKGRVDPMARIAVIAAGLLGWFVGRLLLDVAYDEAGVPSMARGAGYHHESDRAKTEHRVAKRRAVIAWLTSYIGRSSPFR